jgi:two-component system, cell cycle response regulator
MKDRAILVVEDNELNLKLVRALLQKDSYRVLEAGNAEQGLVLAREAKPDLILMDIQLPGMDGLSAVRILKKDPLLQKTPIVALTSYAMDGDVEKAREAGCDGYLAKPVDTRIFSDTIRRFLQDGPPPSPRNLEGRHPRKKILIVDDQPLNLKLLEAQLPSHQYEVFRARDGEECLEKVTTAHPDLILLDIMMPGVDGYEVTRKLKQDPHFQGIPIILVTALGEMKDKLRGLEAGADEFLNKPVHKVELLARIRSLVFFKQLREQFVARSQAGELYRDPMGNQAWTGFPSGKQRVLIVEDDPQEVRLIQLHLRDFSLGTEVVASAEAALDSLENRDVDLLLLDVLLPGMDGFDLCRRLKENPRTRNTQVLFITCLSDLESKAKSFETGGDDLLIKPINGYEFQIRVRTLLKRKEYLDKLDPLPESPLHGGMADPLTRLHPKASL